MFRRSIRAQWKNVDLSRRAQPRIQLCLACHQRTQQCPWLLKIKESRKVHCHQTLLLKTQNTDLTKTTGLIYLGTEPIKQRRADRFRLDPGQGLWWVHASPPFATEIPYGVTFRMTPREKPQIFKCLLITTKGMRTTEPWLNPVVSIWKNKE